RDRTVTGVQTCALPICTLRNNIIPRTIGAVPGVIVGVTGETAANQDFNTLLGVRMPIVFAFVLGLAFPALARHLPLDRDPDQIEIGRASCREREYRRAD